MSGVALHQSSAVVFTHLMNTLSRLLDAAEAQATAKKFDIDVLLNARLAPDMFPLSGQIKIAASFAKNGACRLAGVTPPDYNLDDYKTLADLRGLLTRTIEIVQSVPVASFDGGETRDITFKMGPEITLTLSGADYLNRQVLPNIYFHTTTAYAILRHNGVELGKKDFMTDLLKEYLS